MKVLLLDADSTIPNIALGKLSSFYKNRGDVVELRQLHIPYYPTRKKVHHHIDTSLYDRAFCSVVFDGSVEYVHGDNITYGGTGYSLGRTLAAKIENLEVDYSLYPDCDTSYGFITRGCIRNCKFCKVPKKEGRVITQVSTIDAILRHKKVKFLDNNILAFSEHARILQELIDKKIRHQFNQGLDIRLVTEENSELLSQLDYMGEYIFALDDVRFIPHVDEKVQILKDWVKDWQLKFFVYVHPSMPLSDTVKRVEYLRSISALPYIMRDVSCWGSEHNQFYVDLCAYTNQVHLFKKMPYEEFLHKRHKGGERAQRNYSLYVSNM